MMDLQRKRGLLRVKDEIITLSRLQEMTFAEPHARSEHKMARNAERVGS